VFPSLSGSREALMHHGVLLGKFDTSGAAGQHGQHSHDEGVQLVHVVA
jgi:hypothetical protein